MALLSFPLPSLTFPLPATLSRKARPGCRPHLSLSVVASLDGVLRSAHSPEGERAFATWLNCAARGPRARDGDERELLPESPCGGAALSVAQIGCKCEVRRAAAPAPVLLAVQRCSVAGAGAGDGDPILRIS
ncbi:hypothetical protein BGZ57DRAFT_854594 [Hyaloscypha finlandica]|nr:hypothetical protein BGZ57DRAFT_854594 [Hyaloscypha finlandica]